MIRKGELHSSTRELSDFQNSKDIRGLFLISFAFATILCRLLQRESAFASSFGPIEWRSELRRNRAQDTLSLLRKTFPLQTRASFGQQTRRYVSGLL
jgi:hypothetical protein